MTDLGGEESDKVKNGYFKNKEKSVGGMRVRSGKKIVRKLRWLANLRKQKPWLVIHYYPFTSKILIIL